jgi:hypothetical protein
LDSLGAFEVARWPLAAAAAAPQLFAAESAPTFVAVPVPLRVPHAPRAPALVMAAPPEDALLAGHAPLVVQAHDTETPPEPAPLPPLSVAAPTAPRPFAMTLGSGMPQPPVIPLQFYCARAGQHRAFRRLEWMPRSIPALQPRFALRIAVERVEDILRPPEKRRKSAFAEIFSHSGIAGRRPSTLVRDTVRTIAASVLVGAMLWYGLDSIRHAPSLRNSPPAESSPSSSVADSSPSSSGGASSPPSSSPGLVARIRHAIADRAASELSDSFRAGMVNWGAVAKAWPDGWSRHPDGYVQPGQLALFHPSVSYSDYRMEFFGQIEQKAMDWAVRARDSKNYYAMKFAVVEPGLRPMIAMVHYSVVGGKRSRGATVPLNVMVHNNMPYHVAVEVRGNHIVTSLEGQEVDTWIDDTLPKGGVGFFAEAGEKSRLYWVKITRNQDFLGRVCAILSGNSAGNTQAAVELWPSLIPLPGAPAGPPASGIAAAIGVRLELFGGRPFQSTRLLKNRRFLPWNS